MYIILFLMTGILTSVVKCQHFEEFLCSRDFPLCFATIFPLFSFRFIFISWFFAGLVHIIRLVLFFVQGSISSLSNLFSWLSVANMCFFWHSVVLFRFSWLYWINFRLSFLDRVDFWNPCLNAWFYLLVNRVLVLAWSRSLALLLLHNVCQLEIGIRIGLGGKVICSKIWIERSKLGKKKLQLRLDRRTLKLSDLGVGQIPYKE